jgi:hypothetical protein
LVHRWGWRTVNHGPILARWVASMSKRMRLGASPNKTWQNIYPSNLEPKLKKVHVYAVQTWPQGMSWTNLRKRKTYVVMSWTWQFKLFASSSQFCFHYTVKQPSLQPQDPIALFFMSQCSKDKMLEVDSHLTKWQLKKMVEKLLENFIPYLPFLHTSKKVTRNWDGRTINREIKVLIMQDNQIHLIQVEHLFNSQTWTFPVRQHLLSLLLLKH